MTLFIEPSEKKNIYQEFQHISKYMYLTEQEIIYYHMVRLKE